jgi:hypothetical protein
MSVAMISRGDAAWPALARMAAATALTSKMRIVFYPSD